MKWGGAQPLMRVHFNVSVKWALAKSWSEWRWDEVSSVTVMQHTCRSHNDHSSWCACIKRAADLMLLSVQSIFDSVIWSLWRRLVIQAPLLILTYQSYHQQFVISEEIMHMRSWCQEHVRNCVTEPVIVISSISWPHDCIKIVHPLHISCASAIWSVIKWE